MNLIIKKNREDVIRELMNLIQNVSDEAIRNKNQFLIGVSGGSLTAFLVSGLPTLDTDFTKWKFFFCDERLVPEDSADSTYGFYRDNLLPVVPNLKEKNFVRVKQGVSPNEAAEDYECRIAYNFPGGALPRFDMLLLGMGPDGHTCSLFPGHYLLDEDKRWVAPISDSPKPPPQRITLTYPVINNAANCVFAICGREKGEMVARILVGDEDLPSARVKPTSGRLHWILDSDAAHMLKETPHNI